MVVSTVVIVNKWEVVTCKELEENVWLVRGPKCCCARCVATMEVTLGLFKTDQLHFEKV